MIKQYRRLVRNYILLGLREINKRNVIFEEFSELPEQENEMEQKAFSEAISILKSLILEEPGARETVLYIINEY